MEKTNCAQHPCAKPQQITLSTVSGCTVDNNSTRGSSLPSKESKTEVLAANDSQAHEKAAVKENKAKYKRPFGSIRCRACNRYGVTNKCACSPSAQYSVIIQSKLISRERRSQVRRVAFATVKEAEAFRNILAEECLSKTSSEQQRAYDAKVYPNGPLLAPTTTPRNMLSIANANLLQSSGSIKRPINSPLNLMPLSRRKCDPLLPAALPGKRHPLVAASRTAYHHLRQQSSHKSPAFQQPFNVAATPAALLAMTMPLHQMHKHTPIHRPRLLNPATAAAYNRMLFAPQPLAMDTPGAALDEATMAAHTLSWVRFNKHSVNNSIA